MSIEPTLLIACRSAEWSALALEAASQQGLRARVVPTVADVLREPVNPCYIYFIETDDAVEVVQIPFHLRRQWAKAGLGVPVVVALADDACWERFAFGGDLVLRFVPPIEIHTFKLPKSFAEIFERRSMALERPLRALADAWKSQAEVEEVYYLDLYPDLEGGLGGEVRAVLEGAGVEQVPQWWLNPPRLVDPTKVVVVLCSSFLGDLLGTAYDFVWGVDSWSVPKGLVAVAPEELHVALQRAQVDGRPLFLDICTPEQLQAEGTARVQQWRTQLQTELEAFYAEWAAKLPPPTHAP